LKDHDHARHGVDQGAVFLLALQQILLSALNVARDCDHAKGLGTDGMARAIRSRPTWCHGEMTPRFGAQGGLGGGRSPRTL